MAETDSTTPTHVLNVASGRSDVLYDDQVLLMWQSPGKHKTLEAFVHWGPVTFHYVRNIEDYDDPRAVVEPIAISEEAAKWLEQWDQGTEMWKRFRKFFITATVLAKRIGLGYINDYQGETASSVCKHAFEVDAGIFDEPPDEVTEAMQLGIDNEQLGADLYHFFVMKGEGTLLRPNLLVCRDPGCGHFAVSLDRTISYDKHTVAVDDDLTGYIEIKVSSKTAYESIPVYYYPQIIQQLRVSKREYCDVCLVYLPKDSLPLDPEKKTVLNVIRVFYNKQYWEKMELAINVYLSAVFSYRAGDKSARPPQPLDRTKMPRIKTRPIIRVFGAVAQYREGTKVEHRGTP